MTIEGTYSVPVITHVCLEPHGLTVKWDGDDKMVVWSSTQNVGVVSFGGGTVQNGTLTAASFISSGGLSSATLAGSGAPLTHNAGTLTLISSS